MDQDPRFFAIMGGFHVFDGDIPLHPLVFWDPEQEDIVLSDMIELVETHALIPPSEADIKDKSKGDGFAKAIVLGQTSWFVAQCVARWIQHLPVTELELVTLAYTTLIGGMYFVWWDKPLSIDQPIRIPRNLLGSLASSQKVKDRPLWKEIARILVYGIGLMLEGELVACI